MSQARAAARWATRERPLSILLDQRVPVYQRLATITVGTDDRDPADRSPATSLAVAGERR